MIADQGRLGWQAATDYGQRSLVETTMGRTGYPFHSRSTVGLPTMVL